MIERYIQPFLGAVFCLVLLTGSVSAQTKDGTILVFQFADHRFVMAGDSRTVYKGVANDADCKVFVFENQFVFGSSGLGGYRTGNAEDPSFGWENSEAAERIVRSRPARVDKASDRIQEIATAWAADVKGRLDRLSLINPKLIQEAIERGHGTATSGIFAGSTPNGDIDYAIRVVSLHEGHLEVGIPTFKCDEAPCASGMTDVFTRYMRLHAQEAPEARWAFAASHKKGVSTSMLRAIRLASLTVQQDHSGFVGGPIDAVELQRGGVIRWVQQKPSCRQK